MNESHIEEPIGDDGLTDEERRVLRTPVSKIAPEQRHILVMLHDKKASHIYAENERLRAEERAKKEEALHG